MGGVTCSGLALPVFAAAELPAFQQANLGEEPADVAVGIGQEMSLDAGNYADITVARNAEIVFTGGVYNIGSIIAQRNSTLRFPAPAEIRVLGRFSIGRNSRLGPGPNSTASASSIRLDIGGPNQDPNDPNSQPFAAQIGQGSNIKANFFVPNGTLRIRNNVTATGAFLARDVGVGSNHQGSGVFNLESGFERSQGNPDPPPLSVPPTADPQNVDTDGTNGLVITLTGSDSNDEDLTFTIVSGSGPTLGSLGPVTQVPPSSATVTYTVGQAGDLTDSFVFRVTNESGDADEATVSINLPDDVPDPPLLTNVVVAQDGTAAATAGSNLLITITALVDIADPTEPLDAGAFDFTITSEPLLGELSFLTPSNPPPPEEPPNPALTQLRTSATVIYLAASTGSASFDFEACADLNDDGDTNDAGECDTGTISMTVDSFTPPVSVAPDPEDQELVAEVGVPMVIDLLGAIGDGSVETKTVSAPPGIPAAPMRR